MCQLVLIEKCGASLAYSMTVVEGPVPNKLLYTPHSGTYGVSAPRMERTAYTMHERKHIS